MLLWLGNVTDTSRSTNTLLVSFTSTAVSLNPLRTAQRCRTETYFILEDLLS